MDRGTVQLARGRANINAGGRRIETSWAWLASRTVRGAGLEPGGGVLGAHLGSEIPA